MLTQAEAEAIIIAGVREKLGEIRALGPKPLAVIFKWGGYGDFYLMTCVAAAVSRAWKGAVHPVILTTNTGATPDLDLTAALTGTDIDVLRVPAIANRTWEVLDVCRASAEVVYHVPGYVVKRYTQKGFDDEGQARSDACFADYADFYWDWPQANHRLAESQWDALSQSSGLDVDIRDIRVSMRMPKLDPACVPVSMVRERSSACAARARLRGVGAYAVIHNTAGAGGTTKQMPPATMQDAVDFLGENGVRAVQVGTKREPKYRGVIDRRGFRWPLQCALIAKAAFYLGIEGGLAYAACGVGTPGLLAFGSTPASVFQKPNEIALNAQPCRPCWWSTADWYKVCPQGHEWCANMPTPEGIRRALSLELRHFGLLKREVA